MHLLWASTFLSWLLPSVEPVGEKNSGPVKGPLFNATTVLYTISHNKNTGLLKDLHGRETCHPFPLVAASDPPWAVLDLLQDDVLLRFSCFLFMHMI